MSTRSCIIGGNQSAPSCFTKMSECLNLPMCREYTSLVAIRYSFKIPVFQNIFVKIMQTNPMNQPNLLLFNKYLQRFCFTQFSIISGLFHRCCFYSYRILDISLFYGSRYIWLPIQLRVCILLDLILISCVCISIGFRFKYSSFNTSFPIFLLETAS